MGSIRILFGRNRRRRRRALAGLGATDALGRPAFLYITDTLRKRDQVLREFEGREAFQPAVRVLGELVTAVWHRYGDGRAVLSRRALELAAARLLDDHDGRWPRLSRMGRTAEVAARLAQVEQDLAAHRVASTGDAELNDAIAALRHRLDALSTHVRPSEARERLFHRLRAPSPALLGWLRSYPTVILDDLLQPTPLDIALVLDLCRAWDAAGAHVVLSFESGRDLGGREAGVLMGWDEEGQDAHDTRALGASARLRHAAMQALVATGEATVQVAREEETIEVEPWTELGPPGPRDLADAFADGLTIPIDDADGARDWLDQGRLRLWRCAEPADEARAVARSVKAVLQAGVDPRDCLIAVGDRGVGALLRTELVDHGVPFARGDGSVLVQVPVARTALLVSELAQGAGGPEGWCALADRVRLPLPIDPRILRGWCASAAVHTGPPATWVNGLAAWLVRTRATPETLRAVRSSVAALQPLVDAVAPLSEGVPPDVWHGRLLHALVALGVADTCGDDLAQLQAWAAVVDEAGRLALDLAVVHPGAWPAAMLHEQLHRSLARAHVDPTPRSVARVPVVRVRELLGLTPAHTWVVGLTRGTLPAPHAPGFLLEPGLQRRFRPEPMAEARFLLGSLLRNALGEPWMASVTLSWSATRLGRPAAPSQVLAELLDLPTLGPTTLGELAARPPPESLPSSQGDAIRAATRQPEWTTHLSAAVAIHFERQRLALADRGGAHGARDGLLHRPPDAPRAMSVTALEAYIRCPHRYWLERVLDLAPSDPWAPELEPRRRGTALHRILERFLTARTLRSLAGEPDRRGAAALLFAVATEVMDEVESEGGFDPTFQAYARARWLAGLTDAAPAGILKAWLDSEIDPQTPSIPVAVEAPFGDLQVGPVALKGVLDRLDRLPSGALVVTDYKTGATPTRRQVALGLALQPVAYTEAAAQAHRGAQTAATFLSLRRPDALRRTGWVGDPQVLDEACSPAERRAATAMDAQGRAGVLSVAAAAATALVGGRFPTTPHGAEDAGCRTCPHARVCRVDHPRNADASVSSP